MSLIVLLLVAPAAAQPVTASPNVVLHWNEALLQAVRNERFAPMLAARAFAVTHTCMYDAWALYDPVAHGVHWNRNTPPRQLPGEHTAENKIEAISFAAHAALADLFPSQTAVFDSVLLSLGFSARGSHGLNGVFACSSVLAFRHQDGSNQLGDLHPGAYSDYTGYVPVNAPDALNDPNRWQPLLTSTGPQQFLAPHWGRVLPFAVSNIESLRPEPPPLYGHGLYRKEVNHVLHLSARLDDTTKMIAEYWADGPSTETPPGHWALFAQALSHRDRHSLDDDVKLFFLLGNAVLDASIAVWDCKRAFDFVRPGTAIRFVYEGQRVRAWAGPGNGTGSIDGSQFRSYIATPPFAEYVSGHSAFSAASAEVLRLFSGGDAFGASVTLAAGSSLVEPGLTPAAPVTLRWATFSDAADQAAMSRRYGGIHFESGDLVGRAIGRRVAQLVWHTAQSLFSGSAAFAKSE